MGDRIRMLREAKGWTQDELATRLTARGAAVSGNAVSQWERGETTNLKIPNFLALIDELGTNAHYLWFGRSDPTGRDSTGKFRRSRSGAGNDSKV
jgi:transcriptional regulator with XRE-family HTH domain